METFIDDKTRKAYYVFPWQIYWEKAFRIVARTKHINPNKLETMTGYVKDDELFLVPTRGAKIVLVVYKRTKIDGEG